MANRCIKSIDIAEIFGKGSKIFNDLIEFLKKNASINQKDLFEENFDNWKRIFRGIYGEPSLTPKFFIKHTYFVFLLKSLVIIKLANVKKLSLEDAFKYYKSNSFIDSYITEFKSFYWIDVSEDLIKKIYKLLNYSELEAQDLFFDLYQQIFFSQTRHKIGEFYTPSLLVHKMINNIYKFGLKVLDPSCGSGNFLIEIILRILNTNTSNQLKIRAIENVYGFDINPLAILTTKVNIFLILIKNFDQKENKIPSPNVFILNSLFLEEKNDLEYIWYDDLFNSFDLVIGNPPWLTYKDFNSKAYQKEIRDLAEELKIKPSSQYITHIELATIFFYQIPIKFLKLGGQIFFVITKSVLNGDHCYKFRAFSIFNNIEVWDFPSNYF